jgi:methylmalonyl-CoA mutase N-terminal domain/subunit
MCRFHTQTAGVTLTAQQPDNNIIRTTLQALAAVLGGTQSLHVNSYDEALALPTEESAQLSLRTQQVLAHETGITDTVDPLAGSYYVESLTDRLESGAFEYIKRMDEMGGALGALDSGFQISEIHESAYAYQKQVENEERIVVGVNKYQAPTPPIEQIQTIDPAQTQRQLDRLARVKRDRDASAVSESLQKLENTARGTDNTMPAILQCVEAYATLGEISDVLREVFGIQQEFSPF